MVLATDYTIIGKTFLWCSMLTQKRLKELLHYNPETGVFTWVGKTSSRSKVNIGDIAGTINPKGYRVIRIDYRQYPAHRLAFLFITGKFPANGVDHKNGIPDDNRFDNLREATQAENGQNTVSHRGSSSKYLGVHWYKAGNKWAASIRANGKKTTSDTSTLRKKPTKPIAPLRQNTTHSIQYRGKTSMKTYNDFIRTIINRGEERPDRTGTGTLSYFGPQISFDLGLGFPLVNTKYTPFKLVAAELLWFLSGSTNNNDLKELNGNDNDTIWQGWCEKNGDLGPIYGRQFRSFGEGRVDQIADLVQNLVTKPHSRRHVITAWDPTWLPNESLSAQDNVAMGCMALAPCHMTSQFYVSTDRKLSCKMYQRSCDVFLGLPFNIASYALLTHMLAEQTGLNVGELIITFGDAHLYKNHFDQAKELLTRDEFPLPKLEINPEVKSIFDYQVSDFNITGYLHHPAIKAPVAI